VIQDQEIRLTRHNQQLVAVHSHRAWQRSQADVLVDLEAEGASRNLLLVCAWLR
jgi:hypothetical protein